MADRYMFADSVTGLALMLRTTLTLRKFGFTTRASTTRIAGFTLHVLDATPAPHASRKERDL